MKIQALIIPALALAGLVIHPAPSLANAGKLVQSQMLKQEPPKGSLKSGAVVLVDDGSCGAGKVKRVTGASAGVPRKKECVAKP